MNLLRTVLSIMALLISAQLAPGQRAETEDTLPPVSEGTTWKLVWHDEFDGAKPDESKWVFRPDGKRRDGWWDRKAINLDGNGHLVIKTYQEGEKFIEGCLTTHGKFEHAFGLWCRAASMAAEQASKTPSQVEIGKEQKPADYARDQRFQGESWKAVKE